MTLDPPLRDPGHPAHLPQLETERAGDVSRILAARMAGENLLDDRRVIDFQLRILFDELV